MKTLELTIVIVYAVAMLAIGFYFRSRASKTASSFWSAESNVGVLVNAFALLATVMSGGGMMGNIGLGATLGLAYIACANLGSGAGLGMGALLVARPLRKSGAKTISEFIKMRFPNKAIGSYCYCYSLYCLPGCSDESFWDSRTIFIGSRL